MAKPQFFDYPTFKETKIPKIRLAHWKPVTLYTKVRWLVQVLVVISFVIVPYFHWLKLDFTNQRYWLLGYEVSMVLALGQHRRSSWGQYRRRRSGSEGHLSRRSLSGRGVGYGGQRQRVGL